MARIVFVVTNDLTYDQRMQRICTTLTDAGNDVLLIGRTRKNSLPLAQKVFSQKRLRCLFFKGPLFYAEYNLRVFVRLIFTKADIVCACDLDTACAVVAASWFRNYTTAFDAHEHFSEVPEVERRPLIKRVWNAIGAFCIPKFALRYTVGKELASVLTAQYHAQFHVVRNVPVLTESEILPATSREKLIVYQGALNEGRGLESAILAMRLLPEFKLRLIGEGDLSDHLRHLADSAGLQEQVEFIGFVLPDLIAQYTANAMVGLNLLERRSLNYYYSLANKFFDYMHVGVPSLNMAFPEYEKILSSDPVGATLDTLTPESIAERIRMISDFDHLHRMILACTAARLNYNWNNEQDILRSLYKKIK